MSETEQRARALALLNPPFGSGTPKDPAAAQVHATLYVGDQLARIADALLGEEHASIITYDGGPVPG